MDRVFGMDRLFRFNTISPKLGDLELIGFGCCPTAVAEMDTGLGNRNAGRRRSLQRYFV